MLFVSVCVNAVFADMVPIIEKREREREMLLAPIWVNVVFN